MCKSETVLETKDFQTLKDLKQLSCFKQDFAQSHIQIFHKYLALGWEKLTEDI